MFSAGTVLCKRVTEATGEEDRRAWGGRDAARPPAREASGGALGLAAGMGTLTSPDEGWRACGDGHGEVSVCGEGRRGVGTPGQRGRAAVLGSEATAPGKWGRLTTRGRKRVPSCAVSEHPATPCQPALTACAPGEAGPVAQTRFHRATCRVGRPTSGTPCFHHIRGEHSVDPAGFCRLDMIGNFCNFCLNALSAQ